MRYTVTYRHMPRSQSLEEKMNVALERFSGKARMAHVVFAKDGRAATVSCHLTGPRFNLVVKERGYDLYSVLDTIAHRLSRLRSAGPEWLARRAIAKRKTETAALVTPPASF
jgi:ribosome-associated translation inhibitor RaiA